MVRIWVNASVLKAPYTEPPIVIEVGEPGDVQTVYAHEVEILGPCKVVHDRTATRAPHVYIETEGVVVTRRE